MAKCFQVVGQGVPVRMSDDDAFQVVVRDSDGQYCSKAHWREWHQRLADATKSEFNPLRAKLVGNKITKTDTLARNLQHSRKTW